MPVDAAILGVVDRIELPADALVRPGAGPGIKRPLTLLREEARK